MPCLAAAEGLSMRAVLLLSLCILSTDAAGQKMLPRADPILPRDITPRGWLLKQLRLQAEGLSGHLSHFWHDVMSSAWIGGAGDGGLHERAPYWLNGVVPLSFLLRNADSALLPGTKHAGLYKASCLPNTTSSSQDIVVTDVPSKEKCHAICLAERRCQAYVVGTCPSKPGVYPCWLKANASSERSPSACQCYGEVGPHVPPPVNMTEQVEEYISYVLSHVNPSGWLGPDDTEDGDMYWGPTNVLQSLVQYADNMDDGSRQTPIMKRVIKVLQGHLMEQRARMEYIKSGYWASSRWMDVGLVIQWLLDRAPGEMEYELRDLFQTLVKQGDDWETYFETFQGANQHNVNNAQALKSAAVRYRLDPEGRVLEYTFPQLSKRRMEHLDERYGLPTGMFNGDEILPDPPTRSPSRGIELCGVVEAMFSYNTMFSIHRIIEFADRVERIAFNALPATWASPKGGDMWAHQYLQAVNQVNAVNADPHYWGTDGPLSETYGLEPNYGCCTANFNQGWPKFASMLMYIDVDGALLIGTYAPVAANVKGRLVTVDTSYPFEDTVEIKLEGEPLAVRLRIPGWALRATVNGVRVKNGTFWEGTLTASEAIFIDFKPAIRIERWHRGAITVHRGPLMFSLPLAADFEVYAHHFGATEESSDYYATTKDRWGYAIDANLTNPEKSFTFHSVGYRDGTAPFNHTSWPLWITATVRPIQWSLDRNSAADVPIVDCAKGTICGPPTKVNLVPHGGTDLRIGEFPWSGL